MASRSRAFRVVLVLFGFLAILMAATNPSRQDFVAMLDSQVAANSRGFLDRLTGHTMAGIQRYHLVYRNYVFFSIAESKIGSTPVTYLGAFGNWIPFGS